MITLEYTQIAQKYLLLLHDIIWCLQLPTILNPASATELQLCKPSHGQLVEYSQAQLGLSPHVLCTQSLLIAPEPDTGYDVNLAAV